jgi:glutamate-1-semialdehyde 2,1-aminomutase
MLNADNLLNLGLGVTAALATWMLWRAKRRLELSVAKHPSASGHPRMARRAAKLLPGYHYGEQEFFASDGADAELVQRRRDGFERLAQSLAIDSQLSRAATEAIQPCLPDLQFVDAYRVPFQYSNYLQKHLRLGNFWRASKGMLLENLDGKASLDLTGSYGVNVFGLDFYKDCMEEGVRRAGALGPVLGGYHPSVVDNVRSLCKVSGMDEVTFHMSGTEAVMQAVRLARYHTGRTHLVRFCGAYHGWWDEVQPGPGNPTAADRTYTLRDMDRRSLHVLETRNDIACVLVNPLQALHPNKAAPSDSTTLDSSRSAGGTDLQAYRAWLQQLREVCDRKNIALIFDEVFLGFRLATGGAQQYFGVRADMVTYGKTVAGGMPVGVVCGMRSWMLRFDMAHPADICFARGTFNMHPYVMASMQVFFERWGRPDMQKLYEGLDALWNARRQRLNAALAQASLPVQVANLSTVWSVVFTTPSRYNWMLQFYLRSHGLALSWVGSARLIFTLTCTEEEFKAFEERFISAAQQMQADGWWAQIPGLTNRIIRRRVLGETLRRLVANWAHGRRELSAEAQWLRT